jgi:hypothetical protein
VVDVRDGVDTRLHDVARRLRAIDPLDGRVTALERRLDSLEKPARKAPRRPPRRAKPAAARQADTTAVAEAKHADHDPEVRDDATGNNAGQRAVDAGESEPAR